MDLILKQCTIYSIFASFFLTACGGEGSSSPSQPPTLNKAPVASSDSANTLDNEAVIIEVLANDSDPENDPLIIKSISEEPTFGTVTINNNSITYTPELYYAGPDSFSYQISDGSLTAQAQVQITNSQSYTLAGIVTDEPVAEATITLSVSDQTFTTIADSNGEYSLTVVFDDANTPLLLKAKGSPQNQQGTVELVSYLGNATDVVKRPNIIRQITSEQNAALNITQLSTANYLLAKEKNNGVSPATMERFRQSVDQFTAAELTTLVGFIKLLVDHPDYSVPANESTLSVLQSADNSLFELINAYLTQRELWNEDQPSAKYLADLDIAIRQSLEQQYVGESFTEEMLLDRQILSITKNRNGLVPTSGDVYQFSEDKQGVYHRPANQSNALHSFSDDFSWGIENGRLRINYVEQPHLTGLPFYDYNYILSIWGLETAQEVKELFNQGKFFQLEVLTNTVSEEISVLSKGERQATISSKKTVERIIKIFDIYTATAAKTVTETRSFLFNPGRIFISKTNEDIAGTWAIPLNYTFATNVNDYTTDLQYGLGDQFDIVTFNLDGSASGLLSKNVYTWQLADGAISLETNAKKFIVTPRIENGPIQLATVEYYSENELVNVSVRQMNKSNIVSATQVGGMDLVAELPLTYVRLEANFSPNLWQSTPLKAESIFGYNLTDNFTMRRVFANIVSKNGSPITLFRNDATSWVWSEIESRLTFNRELFNFKQQSTWHVLSKDENGRIYIVDYSHGADDFDNDGIYEDIYPLINPRLTILEPLDLSQYEQIWADSLDNGSLSGL